jgi:hypothetical protein
MTRSLSALLAGLVMLSGAGIAHAADAAQTNIQRKAAPTPIVVTDAKKSKTEVSQAHDRVALTDDQMNKVTAGHFNWTYHWGKSNFGYWGYHLW